ncbi:hypothetical protein E2C01_044274 [Portunus trituberculatus]|uniref:Uncharacterized protein n=1 Tax=Portunus trituberculatus TaxID=210409 RepID=A0A5B7FXZ6_PORTR|nr:hypothetical protein [Portunus trituberculatus]
MSCQIARKSSAFFDTMTYLNAQMEQLKLNHAAVSTLRSGISSLHQEAVLEPVKLLALPRRRENIFTACKKNAAMTQYACPWICHDCSKDAKCVLMLKW